MENLPHVLESDAGVEKALNDLQLEKVGIAIAATTAATSGVGDGC
jgi:hypothetical protein